jgi:cytoskeletal protein RodZ
MAYKVLFFCLYMKVGVKVKEIGAKLKMAREDMGVSVEEVAEDLKLRPSQIENIEEGNMDAFKDIFYLKYFIRDYAKYLGLSYEDMVDDFNEYLFDYTSKISLDDIKKAQKENNKKKVEEPNKVTSPYTIEYESKFPLIPFIVITILVILFAIMIIVIANRPKKDDTKKPSNVIAMNMIK